MVKNPFTPRFGQSPSVIAGRQQITAEFDDTFIEYEKGNPNLCSLVIGPRGTGKTSLLSYIRRAAGNRWISVSTSAIPGMLDDISCQLRSKADHLIERKPTVHMNSINVGGLLQVGWEREEPYNSNWRSSINHVLEQLDWRGTGLLITVDEVDPSFDELTTLVTTFQHFVEEDRKIALVMAGLPANVSQLISGKSTSFLRRARQHHLGRIEDEQVAQAFEETLKSSRLKIAPAALEQATQAIGGFAYMLQLVGYWTVEEHLSHSNTKHAIDEASVAKGIAKAQEDLRNGVVDPTYLELSEGDVRFLEAMLQDDGPSRMSDIAKRMEVSNSYASQYRLRLMSQGVIRSQGRGKIEFDIPQMRECVRDNALLGDFDIEDLSLLNVLSPETLEDMVSYTEEFGHE